MMHHPFLRQKGGVEPLQPYVAYGYLAKYHVEVRTQDRLGSF
jgi:hypothetical protein